MPVPSGSSTLISLMSSAVQKVSACKWLTKAAHHGPCSLLMSPAIGFIGMSGMAPPARASSMKSMSASWTAFLTSIAVRSVGMKVSHAMSVPSGSSMLSSLF